MNPPTDPADEHAHQPVAADPADAVARTGQQPATSLPTMADLDRLSVALDDIDDTLDNLDRRG